MSTPRVTMFAMALVISGCAGPSGAVDTYHSVTQEWIGQPTDKLLQSPGWGSPTSRSILSDGREVWTYVEGSSETVLLPNVTTGYVGQSSATMNTVQPHTFTGTCRTTFTIARGRVESVQYAGRCP